MTLLKNQLADDLQRINQIQPYDSLFEQRFDAIFIDKYYKKLGFFYRKYHSKEGAMHFPIKQNETESHAYKLLFQARSIEDLIIKYNYKTIVELGCGHGFNSIYLAQKFPEVKFTAMDITERNLEIGKTNARHLKNLNFKKLDFNVDNHSYKADLIFGIETLCYSTDLTYLLRSLTTCLNTNGRIVIYDGYEKQTRKAAKLSPDEEKAYKLLCWGFALDRFQGMDEMYAAISANNLSVANATNYTKEILPNYKTLQKGAHRLIKFPLLTKICLSLKILPQVIFMHTLSGIFGPYFLENNFLVYYKFILKKEEE